MGNYWCNITIVHSQFHSNIASYTLFITNMTNNHITMFEDNIYYWAIYNREQTRVA